MNQPNIVCAQSVLFGEKIFSILGKVTIIDDRVIAQQDLINADVLIVRSKTQVDKRLLENTTVKLVATATSGTEHVDAKYLAQQQIQFFDAAGSNANSVAEYVLSALLALSRRHQFSLQEKTLGIIGYGHVGKSVARKAAVLGLKILINDPFIEEQDTIPIKQLLQQADLISLHVPLTTHPQHPTLNLVNKDFLDQMRPDSFLINTARGAVVDEDALLDALQQKKLAGCVLDVWQNEPNINPKLFPKVDFATPHIAGYSYIARLQGTLQIYQQLTDESQYQLADFLSVDLPVLTTQEHADEYWSLVRQVYDIQRDAQNFSQQIKEKTLAQAFLDYRKNYWQRLEFA